MKIRNFALPILLCLFSCKKDSTSDNPPATATKSSEKKVLSFKFTATKPEAVGTVDEGAKKITVSVPYGTVVTSLQPVITISEKASINNTAAADFSKVVTYKVTAEDGSTQDYQVTTTVNSAKFSVDNYTGPTELEAGNGSLLLKGNGFGTEAAKVEVILTNKTTALNTAITIFSVLDNNNIGFNIPATLPLATYSVQVVINGEAVPVPVTLTIVQAAPVIESLSAASLEQKETLTINGRFFAPGNTLSLTFKSKADGTVYTINYPSEAIVSATTAKIEVKLAGIPGGNYTVQVNSNNKTSTAKDIEVVAPVVANKPTIVKINRTNGPDGASFRTDEVMVILVKYISMTPKPMVKFISVNGTSVYTKTGWISAQSMEGSDVRYQVEYDLPKGSYRIAIEQNGKISEESQDIIKII